MPDTDTLTVLGTVGWANRRLAALGLAQTHCVVYTMRAARLLDVSGRELRVVEDDCASFAVFRLVAEFEALLLDYLRPVTVNDPRLRQAR